MNKNNLYIKIPIMRDFTPTFSFDPRGDPEPQFDYVTILKSDFKVMEETYTKEEISKIVRNMYNEKKAEDEENDKKVREKEEIVMNKELCIN